MKKNNENYYIIKGYNNEEETEVINFLGKDSNILCLDDEEIKFMIFSSLPDEVIETFGNIENVTIFSKNILNHSIYMYNEYKVDKNNSLIPLLDKTKSSKEIKILLSICD